MAGGSFAPLFCVAWPTGEVGMGLEGGAPGYRRELEAIEDPAERERTFSAWSRPPTSTARR